MDYKIHEVGEIGEVRIENEVLAIIAGLAATEVQGVSALYGDITNEIISRLGMKKLSKGVKVTVEEDKIAVELAIVIEFGVNIMEVSKTVQDKVKDAIENMTGLEVSEVNIKVSNLDTKSEK